MILSRCFGRRGLVKFVCIFFLLWLTVRYIYLNTGQRQRHKTNLVGDFSAKQNQSSKDLQLLVKKYQKRIWELEQEVEYLKGFHKGQKGSEINVELLVKDYRQKMKDIQSKGFLRKWGQPKRKCHDMNVSRPCFDHNCSSTVHGSDHEAFQGIVDSMAHMPEKYITDLSKIFGLKEERKKFVFLTGASSNHYKEAQALLKNLHTNVFPYVTNYSFYFYDLGLKTNERKQVEKHCKCEVRSFPFYILPRQEIRCYTWKPIIIQAHFPTSDFIIWSDSSVRFYPKINLAAMFTEVKTKGLLIQHDVFPISDHTSAQMFTHFKQTTCEFSGFPEVRAGSLFFHNEKFVRTAILRPWLACAFDPRCMCPGTPSKSMWCNGRIKKYNQCHRFDQSAMSVILTKLFGQYVGSLNQHRRYHTIKRDDRLEYFTELEKKYSKRGL